MMKYFVLSKDVWGRCCAIMKGRYSVYAISAKYGTRPLRNVIYGSIVFLDKRAKKLYFKEKHELHCIDLNNAVSDEDAETNSD